MQYVQPPVIFYFSILPYFNQINGSLTLGENIADNGGVKSSYQVCTIQSKGNGSNIVVSLLCLLII